MIKDDSIGSETINDDEEDSSSTDIRKSDNESSADDVDDGLDNMEVDAEKEHVEAAGASSKKSNTGGLSEYEITKQKNIAELKDILVSMNLMHPMSEDFGKSKKEKTISSKSKKGKGKAVDSCSQAPYVACNVTDVTLDLSPSKIRQHQVHREGKGIFITRHDRYHTLASNFKS